MRPRIADAFAKAAIAYPFLIIPAAVLVAIEATRTSGAPGDAIGWLLWSFLWVSIAALAAVFVAVPALALEFLIWGRVARRWPAIDHSMPAVITSCAVLALPWAIAPWAESWGAAALVFVGLTIARLAVPSLRIGAFTNGATRD